MSDDIVVKIDDISTNQIIEITNEKYLKWMLNFTFIPLINNKYKIIKYTIPWINALILFVCIFSFGWYPEYYPMQGEVWISDVAIGSIVYSYMLYLYRKWDKSNINDDIIIPKWKINLSFVFYIFFIIYWFYFAVIQFNHHNQPDSLTQFKNTVMSYAWYLFFSVMATLYYFICIKLCQRAHSIRAFLKKLKKKTTSIETFYEQYNQHHEKIKKFSRYWNFIIFLGFLLLTFHVPIDLISIVYNKYYYDIPGFIIKLLALVWYTRCICQLNNYEGKIIPYLYKHKVYSIEQIDEIEKYISYRKIGLDFYGIKINGSTIIKVTLILLNLVIPTLYALFSSKILNV